MRRLLILLMLFAAYGAKGQDTTVKKETFQYVEQMPEYPGGTTSMEAYIKQNLKYPEVAIRKGTCGKVYIKFVVDVDGAITDVAVVRGIGNECDEEALRVVKEMPQWNPGKQRGKPVRVALTIPVNFKLSNTQTEN